MSERATPETDAATMPWYGERDAVVGDFARKLERQRDEAREIARELRDALQPTLTSLVGRMVIKDTDTVERAHAALNKAKEVLG